MSRIIKENSPVNSRVSDKMRTEKGSQFFNISMKKKAAKVDVPNWTGEQFVLKELNILYLGGMLLRNCVGKKNDIEYQGFGNISYYFPDPILSKNIVKLELDVVGYATKVGSRKKQVLIKVHLDKFMILRP